MLTYFPTPYPDELWYSVISRYLVRSGVKNSAPVLFELYGQYKIPLELFPSTGPYRIAQKLPVGVIDCKTILLEHTLLPYLTRFFSEDKKAQALDSLMKGSPAESLYFVSNEWQGLQYCPICYREDSQRYGEPYWHREHQISLMPLCPKHKCRLLRYEASHQTIKSKLIPLCSIQCENTDLIVEKWETQLTDILNTFLTLPYHVCMSDQYSNLRNALINAGFGSSTIHKNYDVVDARKVEEAVKTYFGPAIHNFYFKRLTQGQLLRIFLRSIVGPERFALLAVLAGMRAETLFGPEIPVMDALKEKLEELKSKGMWRKDQIAREMGITTTLLTSLMKKYDIAAFWQKPTHEMRTSSVKILLTDNERQRLQKYADKYANGQHSVFARELLDCVLNNKALMNKVLRAIRKE